jgi:flagellar biosynthesis repressor protein FlbT
MIRPGVRGFVSHEKVAGWPIICCHCCFGGDCVSTPPGKVQVTCHVSQDHAEKDERLIVDGAVIRNGGKASVLFIENVIPILREKDIMGEKEADTPCKRIYFILQLMYIDEPNLQQYRDAYWQLAQEIVGAVPAMTQLIETNKRAAPGRKVLPGVEGGATSHRTRSHGAERGLQHPGIAGAEVPAAIVVSAAALFAPPEGNVAIAG